MRCKKYISFKVKKVASCYHIPNAGYTTELRSTDPISSEHSSDDTKLQAVVIISKTLISTLSGQNEAIQFKALTTAAVPMTDDLV